MVNQNKVEADLRKFCQEYPAYSFKKNAVIVRAGDVPQDIHYISQGKVQQFDITPGGNEVIINVFAKPAFLSVFWLFDAVENKFAYRAVTDVRVHRVPRADFQKFLAQNPDVLFATLQRVVRGLDGFMVRMAYQMYGSAEKKIANELLLEAKRFHKLHNDNVKLEGSINDLTARTGLARETVSRQISNLQKKELIKKEHNKIIIVNVALLEAFTALD